MPVGRAIMNLTEQGGSVNRHARQVSAGKLAPATGRIMSEWEIRGLETNFEGFRRDRYPSLSTSDAFERFAIWQVLKDDDLSGDEIESGILGGGDDGGV